MAIRRYSTTDLGPLAGYNVQVCAGPVCVRSNVQPSRASCFAGGIAIGLGLAGAISLPLALLLGGSAMLVGATQR
jgi:hypothetical protein